MPKGSHNYFKQIDPWGGRVSVDDPEFEAQVRAKIGDPYKDLVNKALAQNVGSETGIRSLLGVNLTKTPEKDRKTPDYTGAPGAFLSFDQKKPIIGVGAGASPQTFAHEFRHNVEHDEYRNRLYDLMYSNSPTQYAANLEFAYNRIAEPGKRVKSLADKEKYVLAHLYNLPEDIDINKHIKINQGDTPFTFSKTTELGYPRGAASKAAIKERVQYPFLNFVGLKDLPDPAKYKAGGSIENTTHDRKLI